MDKALQLFQQKAIYFFFLCEYVARLPSPCVYCPVSCGLVTKQHVLNYIYVLVIKLYQQDKHVAASYYTTG